VILTGRNKSDLLCLWWLFCLRVLPWIALGLAAWCTWEHYR
jgi:hypothetical protein